MFSGKKWDVNISARTWKPITNIICKKLLNSYYSCVGICNGVVVLQIFSYISKSSGTTTNCEMVFSNNIKMSKLSSHTNIEVYETTENNIDIICAQNINSRISKSLWRFYRIGNNISN